MNTYFPEAYGGPKIDYSWISDLGNTIGGAIEKRMDTNAVKSALAQATGPDGAVDYNKAFGNLLAAGRTKEAQVIANYAESQAMGQYRQDSLAATADKASAESPDMKLWREWQASQGGATEPMRASPPQPSGVPGVSFQTAPAFITDKLAPVSEKKRLEEVGKGQGERDAKRAMLEQDVAPGLQKMIDQFIVNAKEADDTTFGHALGPLQGAGEAETWQGALTNFIPQTWGALENYYQQGKKAGFIGGEGKNLHIKEPGELPGGYTSTLRSKINSTQASLVSVLQRALRVPGIGAQSDAELRQIIAQVGELNKSRDKADFYDRLSNVVSNLSNLGIPVEMPTSDEIAGTKPTDAAVRNYTQPANQQEAGAPAPYDAAEESPVQGSAVDTGRGIPGRGAPPLPATGDKNKLIYLMNNAPPEVVKQKMEEFDKLYNWPGLASIILGQSRAGR
jgi:hypothetical protein